MQIVIEIEEDYYEIIKYEVEHGHDFKPYNLIANGTQLPRHHGRLIDADKLQRADHIVLESTVDNAPTIIEGSESE